MAAIIFVKKLLSTRSPKLRLLCRLIIFFNVLGKRCANVFGNCVNNQSGFSRIRHVAKLLVGVRQWHSYFIPLFVVCTFPGKSKVSFDILEMCHQGTQKKLEFGEFLDFFKIPHLWLDSQDALRDRKKYDATKVYSPTLTFFDASL